MYNPQYQSVITANEGVNHLEQLRYILVHPFQFIKILFVTLKDYMPSTMVHYVAKFGYEKNYLSLPFTTMLWGIVLLQLGKNYQFGTMVRALFFTVGAIIVVCFSMVMYLLWTPVGESTIWNWGGRYFIPVFPLFLLAFAGLVKLPEKYHSLIDICSLAGIAVCNFALVFAILQRYYWVQQ